MSFHNSVKQRCLLFLTLFILLFDSAKKEQLVLAYKSFSDFSDVFLNSFQLIQKYRKVTPESHTVLTSDGYKVNLFRLPNKGPPVLLAHGIGDSSDSWLVVGPDNSLAFMLNDIGFDVWLYNARGNKYSKGHKKTWILEKDYWDFSFDEMGGEDLPSTIDYILQNTSYSKLSYVGFSQGSTLFFVMSSLRPKYRDKIKQAILLAPVSWISGLQYPFIKIVSENLDRLTKFRENGRIYEVFSSNPIQNLYHARVCQMGVPEKVLCDMEYYTNYGLLDTSYLIPDRLPVIASHIPAGTSAKTFLHFIQGYTTKEFQRYDYGLQKNLIKYSASRPPEFNVSMVNSPLTLFYSEFDWFTASEDIERLKSRLPKSVKYVVVDYSMNFSHLEFVYGWRAKTLINKPVINLLINSSNL